MKIKAVFYLIAFLLIPFLGFCQIGFQTNIISDLSNSILGAENIFSADLDGDGDEDLLAAGRADNKIIWYEYIGGEEKYAKQRVISSSIVYASDVYAGDLDGDGDMDVLASSYGDDKIVWFENKDGLGDFSGPRTITSDLNGAEYIHIADLDNDGDQDVLAASNISGSRLLVWYENTDGLGSFGQEILIREFSAKIHDIATANINGNGGPEILVAAVGNTGWFRNLGGGNFSDLQVVDDGNSPRSIFSADLNGDGDMDMVIATLGRIYIHLNNDGNGSFDEKVDISGLLDWAHKVYAADMDGDGDNDIIVCTNGDDQISWFENLDGLGSFGSKVVIDDFVQRAIDVIAHDNDNDGDIDVAALSKTYGLLSWYENTGLGNFEDAHYVTDSRSKPNAIEIIDIDQDSDHDVVVSYNDSDKMSWFENTDGDGALDQEHVIVDSIDRLFYFGYGDMDHNGEIDIVSAGFTSGVGNIHYNMNGTFTTNDETIGGDIVTVADLDQDGWDDIMGASVQSPTPTIRWYKNLGNGEFDAPIVITSEALGITSVLVADVNFDGILDIISTSEDDDKLAYYINDGAGNFGGQEIILSYEDPTSVIMVDIKGNDNIDEIIATFDEGRVVIYHLQSGQWGNWRVINVGDGCTSVAACDIDFDGDLDLVTNSSGDMELILLENDNDSFSKTVVDSDWYRPNLLRAEDMDRDGDIDIIASSWQDDIVVWYENLGVLGNQLEGQVRLDLNSNGCDEMDLKVPDAKIFSDNGGNSFATFSDDNGQFLIKANEGNFTTSVLEGIPDFYESDPSSFMSDFVGIGNSDYLDFCLTASTTINDLVVSLYSLGEARPGFDTEYLMVYSNRGTTVLSGQVTFEYDEQKVQYLSSSENPSSQSNNQLVFDYADINPFETRTIQIKCNVLPPPTVSIGDHLISSVSISPMVDDNNQGDNLFELDQLVIGSYDPNDIRVMEGDQITIVEIENYLHYIIRFQNTGTASAIHVRVENELDANLDWATLQLEETSHEGHVEIVDGNQVSFIFQNINLPDSTSNLIESQGFIAYKIKPLNTLIVGNEISNQADIYFDFNPPVITNMVVTEVVDPVSTVDPKFDNINFYPNPVKDILYINERFKSLEIFDLSGRSMIKTEERSNLDVDFLQSGVYVTKLINANGDVRFFKFVKSK